ncbi:MAG: hypothetical protein QNK05_13855 [Myxococcota bacterium]|nr:hypothetical protein [Myxococcota bacterium]
MLPGFNTNIRHRQVLFHVQSEDSGLDHPHVITHLYHGGTIIVSEKTSYADSVDSDDLPTLVRKLMEGQHKTVLKSLRAGAYDDVIHERLGSVFGEDSDTEAQLEPSETAPAVDTGSDEPVAPPPVEDGRSFGEGIVSERPLDEVILGYLVENARKRKRKQ